MHSPDDDPHAAPDLVALALRSPYGAVAAIVCAPGLVASLLPLLGAWTPRLGVAPGEPPLYLTERAGGSAHPLYDVSPPDATPLMALDHDTALAGVQQWLDGRLVAQVHHLTPVHAGVVVWRGRAVLIPGLSGAGKTTLVSALVDRGATYYSDEFGLVDASGGIHPYRRPLLVRDARGHVRPVPPPDGPAGTAAVGACLLAAVRFAPSAPLALSPVPASQALLILLANTPHRLASVTSTPQGLIRVAATAVAFIGTHGDAAVASAAVLELADRAPCRDGR